MATIGDSGSLLVTANKRHIKFLPPELYPAILKAGGMMIAKVMPHPVN
jgi:hypothetical protein